MIVTPPTVMGCPDAHLAPLGLAAAVAVAACGGDGDKDPAGEDAASTAISRGSAPSAADPTCADGALGERRYILCTASDQADRGLVVALHGRGSSAAAMQAGTGLHDAAAAEGLAFVYPESLDGRWGDDTFTSLARPAGDEDVVFLDALVEELRADDRIADESDIGVVGFSSGASMAMRCAVERPRRRARRRGRRRPTAPRPDHPAHRSGTRAPGVRNRRPGAVLRHRHPRVPRA